MIRKPGNMDKTAGGGTQNVDKKTFYNPSLTLLNQRKEEEMEKEEKLCAFME